MAWKCASALGLDLQFLSYPQQSEPGQAMREEIVRSVKPVDRDRILKALSPDEKKRDK
jgi:hypothetical protein